MCIHDATHEEARSDIRSDRGDGELRALPRRPGPRGLARAAVPQESLAGLQRRVPRRVGPAHHPAHPRRREGHRRLPGSELGGGGRARRREADGCHRQPRHAGDPQHALHRHVRAARLRLRAALRQPPRCDRGRPGRRYFNLAGHIALDYLYGSRRRSDSIRDPPPTPPASSSGAPTPRRPRRIPTSTGYAEAPGTIVVIDPIAYRDRPARRPAPAAVPRLRRGARLRAAPRPRHATGWPTARSFADHTTGCRRTSSRCWTPARRPGARRTTGVPAALTSSARRTSTVPGPSLLWLGQGLQRQPMGGNVDARLRTAAGGDGEPGQARQRVPLPERSQRARDR